MCLHITAWPPVASIGLTPNPQFYVFGKRSIRERFIAYFYPSTMSVNPMSSFIRGVLYTEALKITYLRYSMQV